MSTQIEQYRTQFNGMSTSQKKAFINNLKEKLQGKSNPEYKQFLQDCITKYNTEVQASSAQHDSVATREPVQMTKKGRMIGPNNVVRNVKLGYCWPMFFFGCFCPLARGDGKWFALSLFLSIITVGICWIVFPFIYNKIYIKGLLEKGYRPESKGLEAYFRYKGVIA